MRNLTVLTTLFSLFLPVLAAAEAPTTVVVVRHAEKATGQGDDPHLTEAGQARAAVLASLLRTQAIGGLYTSEFHRTRETLLPLAELSGVEIATVPARQTIETLPASHLLDSHPGQLVVISSHSNLAPEIVEALTGEVAPAIDDSTYDDLFVVTLHEDGSGHFLRLKYGEPSSP